MVRLTGLEPATWSFRSIVTFLIISAEQKWSLFLAPGGGPFL
jgi:hypothetical protein